MLPLVARARGSSQHQAQDFYIVAYQLTNTVFLRSDAAAIIFSLHVLVQLLFEGGLLFKGSIYFFGKLAYIDDSWVRYVRVIQCRL